VISAPPARRLGEASTAIDQFTLRNIALAFGGDDVLDGGCVLMLNKKDLITPRSATRRSLCGTAALPVAGVPR